MKVVHIIAFILLVVGGINWGLVGLGEYAGANWNVVDMVLGQWPMVESLVYVLVGISAVWLLIGHKHACRECAA